MKKIKYVSLVMMLLSMAITSQAAVLKGKVIDKDSKEPLIGASVMVFNTTIGETTDIDGNFTLNVSNGATTLEVSYISYVTQLLEVEANDQTPLLVIELAPDAQSISEVTVSVRKNLESEVALQTERIASNVAIENLGAKEMSIKGISNVEDGVKKITGISIEDSGQVLVRGLGDRYSLTTMNGLLVASPNPDNKLIPLDLFPSSVVKNITVSKVYSATAFADYSGALIDIATKDVVTDDFLTISADIGGLVGTTGRDFYKSDRASLWSTPTLAPEVRDPKYDGTLAFRDYMKSNNPFETNFSASKSTALPDFGFGLSAGKNWSLFGRDLSALISVNVSNKSEAVYDAYLKTLDINGDNYKITEDEDSYKTTLSTTALASLNYALSEDSRISYSMFYSRSAEDKYYTYWCNNDSFTAKPEIRGRNSVLHIYELLNNQLRGEHKLNEKFDLDWSFSHATTSSSEPDRRQSLFLVRDGGWESYTADSKNTIRYFGNIDENELVSSINLKYYLGEREDDNTLKLGFNSRHKTRTFDAILFAYAFQFEDSTGASLNPTFSSIYDTNDVLNYENIANGNFDVKKLDDPSYTYNASATIYAGYADLDYNFGDVLFNLGVRYEQSVQDVDYTSDLGAGHKSLDLPNLFPAANIRWSVADQHSLRLAMSKTVTRPSFVEMAPFRYRESGSSGTSVGNENLQNGYNYNVDLRYEFFKDKSTDMLSLTGYYKFLDQPIERIQRDAGGDVEFSYQNSDSGMAAGLEFELRKKIVEGLNFGFNASYIYTNVFLEEGKGIYTETQRQLQGASPYLVNADLAYTHRRGDDSQMTVSLVYNLQGPRIEAVGVEQLCDVMQEDFHTLNLVYNYQINSKLSLKARVDNILGQKIRYTQYVEKLGRDIAVGEESTYVGGSIGLSYNF